MRLRPRDTIATRLALAIVLAITVALTLNWVLVLASARLGRPPLERTGLLDRAATIVRLVEAAPEAARPALLAAAGSEDFTVDWYPDATPVPATVHNSTETEPARRALLRLLGDPDRPTLFFTAADLGTDLRGLRYDRDRHPSAYFLALPLRDRGWLVFTVFERSWGIPRDKRIAIAIALLALSTLLVSFLTARQLAAPMRRFAEAARRFGSDPHAPPLAEAGPAEFRVASGAFNAMQAQIGRFIADRTEMLAAISHDLRTPLTRIRLRAEFVEDEEQQARLFRDVDEMQAMVDAALAFFRDDASEEGSTKFDLAELLRTIIDDFADQGIEVDYRGPDHFVLFGRPFALKRAFTNLIDNAVRYGKLPAVELRARPEIVTVAIEDSGPGIPADQIARVLAPFQRLEPSRSRLTGGYGLGLSVARTIIHRHGGDLELRNRPTGGLEALSTLPQAAG